MKGCPDDLYPSSVLALSVGILGARMARTSSLPSPTSLPFSKGSLPNMNWWEIQFSAPHSFRARRDEQSWMHSSLPAVGRQRNIPCLSEQKQQTMTNQVICAEPCNRLEKLQLKLKIWVQRASAKIKKQKSLFGRLASDKICILFNFTWASSKDWENGSESLELFSNPALSLLSLSCFSYSYHLGHVLYTSGDIFIAWSSAVC